MIRRDDLLAVVGERIGSDVVVPVMSAAKGWGKLPEHFFWCTAMGYGSSVGLGLALAQPGRRVVVLDGDGSLLMNLGSLVTIAALQPPNLVEVVLENGLWELPGAVPLPGSGRASLTGFARSAGWKQVVEVDSLEAFRAALERALVEPGPWFLSARVAPGSGQGLPALRLVDMTRRLRASLAR
jgi:phosphonopyruvate decarboxylase